MAPDFWFSQGDSVSTPLSPGQRTRYEAYLHTWQSASHPALFVLEDWRYKDKRISLRLCGAQDFMLLEQAAPSGFEKQAALCQALDALHAGIRLCPHPAHARFHRAGCARWLPAQPEWLDAPQSEAAWTALFAAWFGYRTDGDDMPWEWRTFHQVCLERPDPRLGRRLLTAWPYLTGNRLGMKDRLLGPGQAAHLARFGALLGLPEAERRILDRLAQQDDPDFEEFL